LLVGQVLEARGDKAGAAAAYRRALELEPGLAGARAGLARLGVKGS
ncbi:MAG: tetratricopeptide repeat protein, partial [Acidobacteria bacterium]